MAAEAPPNMIATTCALPSKMAPELWMNCFRYLSQTDLTSCMSVCSKWYYIADNPLLWKDLDLSSLLQRSYHLPVGHVPSEKLLARIEKAQSIKAVPRLTKKFTRTDGRQFGEDFAYILHKYQRRGPLPNLRSLTFQSSLWAKGLSACLPHLVNLDISRVVIDCHGLTSVIDSLGKPLRKLILDGLQICRWTVWAILKRQCLEHVSLAMCRIRHGVLHWFLTGLSIPPTCEHCFEPRYSQLLSGCRQNPDSAFQECAAKIMPCLRELDLRYLDYMHASWLHQFHNVRLGLSEEEDSLVSENPKASGSSETREMYLDVRGCKYLSLADLQGLECSWPGTTFTPSLKAMGQ